MENIPSIPQEDIEILGKINESNISIVSHGRIYSTSREVVIKKFKSKITSDGYARDDITTSTAIGQHKNLISTLAIMRL
jgi:hypothetical protein